MEEYHFVKVKGPENENIVLNIMYDFHSLLINNSFDIEDRISILFSVEKIIIKAIIKGKPHTLYESLGNNIYFKEHLIKTLKNALVNDKQPFWRRYIVDEHNNLKIVNK